MAARKTAAPAGKPPLENTADQTPTENPEDELPPGETAEEQGEPTAEQLAREAHLAALRYEREGYVRHGREDRMADVDAELERLGEKPSATG